MPIGAPNSLTSTHRYFREPDHTLQRQYEALRAYFVDDPPLLVRFHRRTHLPIVLASGLINHPRRGAVVQRYYATPVE